MVSSSDSIAIAAGGRTVDVIANRFTSRANSWVSNWSIVTMVAPVRMPNTMLYRPAHTDNDTGTRLTTRRFGATGVVPPVASSDGFGSSEPSGTDLAELGRSLRRTPSIRSSTPSCSSNTGLGLPVVPEVNWMRATSGP